jgi:Asp-tRNA(Asn)/Glu-tRNA(Gln) amidotransferase A subunit family amidase
VRVGYDARWSALADDAIAAAVERLVRGLAARGAVIVDVTLDPALHEQVRLCHAVVAGEELAAFLLRVGVSPGEVAAATRMAPLLAQGTSATTRRNARALRPALLSRWQAALAGIDVLVTPSTGTTAPLLRDDMLEHGELDTETLLRLTTFTQAANLFGYPALGLPAGFAGALPFGVQVHGRFFDEVMLFRVGAVLSDLAGDDGRRPARFSTDGPVGGA